MGQGQHQGGAGRRVWCGQQQQQVAHHSAGRCGSGSVQKLFPGRPRDLRRRQGARGSGWGCSGAGRGHGEGCLRLGYTAMGLQQQRAEVRTACRVCSAE